jgi:predicted transcriptional regulator
VGSDGEVKEKVKKGGFHKLYHLSAPLADLVGEPTVSNLNLYSIKFLWSKAYECSSRAPKPLRKYGSTSKRATCKTRTINARSGATRRCSWCSNRRRCTCSP